MVPQMVAGQACAWPLSRHAAPPTLSSAAKISSEMRSMSHLLDHHRRSVGDDLAHGLADFGRVEAHHDDGVAAHEFRVPDQAVHGVAARLFQQRVVLGDLAAVDGAQAGHHIARQSTAAHHHAKHLALDVGDAVAGDIFSCHDQHDVLSLLLEALLYAASAPPDTAIAACFYRCYAATQAATCTCGSPAVIWPITAASPKPSRANSASTSSTLAGSHDTSRPPEVCGSVSSMCCACDTPAASVTSLP